jgi:nucleotide-binding universal stress UspA family protein
MRIIVPTAGPVPDQRTADYVIDTANRLHAQVIVLRILSENETATAGESSLRRFLEIGKKANVSVKTVTRRGDIVSAIMDVALKMAVDLIILGASHGEIVAEWMNARAMEKTAIPVLLIPKWVPAAKRSSSNG